MNNSQEINWFEFKQLLDEGADFRFVIDKSSNYRIYALDASILFLCTIPKDEDENKNLDQIDFEDNYMVLALSSLSNKVEVTEQTPFARPDYRTKMDAIPNWITCSPDTATIMDFTLTEERYVTGGEIIFKNAKEGDYITAEVYDGFTGGVIPEPYRATLCEAWPTVAQYVTRRYLVPTIVDGYGVLALDTYPLNAKISQYLQLRVTYHSTDELGDRRVTVNYNLTKKL